MIRISEIHDSSRSHLLVEGKLSAGSVDILESSWLKARSELTGEPVRVDLSGVTYVDPEGRALLERMIRTGTELEVRGVMLIAVIEEITNERRQ